MIDFTPIARIPLGRKAQSALRAATTPEITQRRVLDRLLRRGARTKWGAEHGLSADLTYERYARLVAVADYEAFRPCVMRMIRGEADVLWPGVTRRYSQSSGTTGGKSKYVPVTADSLRLNHYAGAGLAVALYLNAYPDSRMFSGKGFILGGSFANELQLPPEVKVGDMSAQLIEDINPVANLFRAPDKATALMEDWKQKLPALVKASAWRSDITNISGVPSWFLRVLQSVLQARGAERVQDVWPRLEVFFHGGIAFAPYRDEYAKIMAPGMRYWETYNASEGFFAAQSAIDDEAMLLMVDSGVFYEFRELDSDRVLPPWAVTRGKTYDMIITAPNGLWRYDLGDTVTIKDTNPLKIVIAGRTKCYINAFGEEVMVHNTDAAIAKACSRTGCTAGNYTVAPVFSHDGKRGRHQWLIEWATAPADPAAFAALLDALLQAENSDYQAKRSGNIFLDPPEIIEAPAGLFDRWLALTGKLGGQRKVPRLSNDRHIMQQLLNLKSDTR